MKASLTANVLLVALALVVGFLGAYLLRMGARNAPPHAPHDGP